MDIRKENKSVLGRNKIEINVDIRNPFYDLIVQTFGVPKGVCHVPRDVVGV